MKVVVWMITFVLLALIEKAVDRDKERMIDEFVKSQKERESKE